MRDYILRLIEQFGLIWRKIVRLHEAGSIEEAQATINTAYRDLFDTHSHFVDLLPDEDLLKLVQFEGTIDLDRCAVLAALHVAEGQCFQAQAMIDEAYRRFDRALMLYGALVRSGQQIPPEVREAAKAGLHELSNYELEPATLDDAWRVYAAVGDYPNAEDHLWQWLEATEFAEAACSDAQAWYHQLLTRSDASLEQLGLPRPEIEQSLAQLATH
jgi:hypothetical protein